MFAVENDLDVTDLQDSAWLAFAGKLHETMAVASVKCCLSYVSTILKWFNVSVLPPPALTPFLAGLEKLTPKVVDRGAVIPSDLFVNEGSRW